MQTSRGGLADFTSSQLLLDLAIFNSVRYLEDITLMEAELGVVYQEVESVIRTSWIAMRNATIEDGLAWVETSANP
ncbi:MAG: hypothetical protein WD448_09070 [Woeseia sp.]